MVNPQLHGATAVATTSPHHGNNNSNNNTPGPKKGVFVQREEANSNLDFVRERSSDDKSHCQSPLVQQPLYTTHPTVEKWVYDTGHCYLFI
jgi:hypothetical protein